MINELRPPLTLYETRFPSLPQWVNHVSQRKFPGGGGGNLSETDKKVCSKSYLISLIRETDFLSLTDGCRKNADVEFN